MDEKVSWATDLRLVIKSEEEYDEVLLELRLRLSLFPHITLSSPSGSELWSVQLVGTGEGKVSEEDKQLWGKLFSALGEKLQTEIDNRGKTLNTFADWLEEKFGSADGGSEPSFGEVPKPILDAMRLDYDTWTEVWVGLVKFHQSHLDLVVQMLKDRGKL